MHRFRNDQFAIRIIARVGLGNGREFRFNFLGVVIFKRFCALGSSLKLIRFQALETEMQKYRFLFFIFFALEMI
jgi:hypothetical protein